MRQRRKRVESNNGFLPQTHKRVERGKKQPFLGVLHPRLVEGGWVLSAMREQGSEGWGQSSTGLLWESLSWWVAGLPTWSYPTTSSLTAHCTPVIFQIEARANLLLSLGMKLKLFRVAGRPLVTCLLPTQPFKLTLVKQAFCSSSYCPLVVTWVKTDVPFLYFNCCLPFKSLIKRGCCLWEVSVARGVHIFPGTTLPNVILYGCCWSLCDAGDRIQVVMHSRIVVYH